MRFSSHFLLGPVLLLAVASGCSGGFVEAAPGPDVPLSSVVALRASGEQDIPSLIKAKVGAIDGAADLEDDGAFPLTATNLGEDADSLRLAGGLEPDVLLKWLDPLTGEETSDLPRFGSNSDFTAYFGDGWDEDWSGPTSEADSTVGASPRLAGDSEAGWLWVNHKYVSDSIGAVASAPTGQHFSFADFLVRAQLISLDIATGNAWTAGILDAFIGQVKKQVGGSWVRIVKDGGKWTVDRSVENLRYDATDKTLFSVTGIVNNDGSPAVSVDRKDTGTATLDPGVVTGTLANAGGAVSPWGTVFSAEGQWQQYYGDSEPWNNQNKLTGGGFAVPGNAAVPVAASTTADFGKVSAAFNRHAIDVNGYLAEIEPGLSPAAFYDAESGSGHRKLGTFGRARWQNATFAVNDDWELIGGEPVVIYATDDRQGGRLYKLVTNGNYENGLTKAEVRALLDDVKIYVAEFADPLWDGTTTEVTGGNANGARKRLLVTTGYQIQYDTDPNAGSTLTTAVPSASNPGIGWWVELDVNSSVLGPPASRKNPTAVATTSPAITGVTTDATFTVSKALKSQTYNLIAGFPKQADLLKALSTASTKLGVTELNRPQDVEYNPVDGRLYIAFNRHTARNSLDQNGRQVTSTNHDISAARTDRNGAIFAIEEYDGDPAANGPGAPFEFWSVWRGTAVDGTLARYDVSNPSDLVVDQDGGLWFTTSGNFLTNTDSATRAANTPDGENAPDGIYYLDLDPGHTTTRGYAFRIAKLPQDAKAKGISFSPDQKTLFFSVQAPGEASVQTPGESLALYPSTWPQER